MNEIRTQRIEAIQKRVAAATPGKWGHVPIFGEETFYIWGDNMEEGVASEVFLKEDAEFIGHARQDIPLLLEEIHILDRRFDTLELEVKQLREHYDVQLDSEKELDVIDQILAKFKGAREEHTPCE